MPGPLLSLLYFLSYLAFGACAKLLGSGARPTAILLGSTLVCCGVVAAVLLGDLATRWLRGDDALRPEGAWYPSLMATALRRYSERDVVVASACSVAVMLSSTAAYSLPGVGLLLPLVLMKGGVNLWGPVVAVTRGEDGATSPRAVAVLLLTLAAVAATLADKVRFGLGTGLIVALAGIYVLVYYPKISTLRRHVGDGDFVVAELALTVAMALPVAAFADATALRWGGCEDVAATMLRGVEAFVSDWRAWLMGLGSEGAALFGGLLLMRRGTATKWVPLNRCVSLLAGIAASAVVAVSTQGWGGYVATSRIPEMVGAAFMLAALWIGLRPDAKTTPSLRLDVAAATA